MKKRLLYTAFVMLFFGAMFTINTYARNVDVDVDTECRWDAQVNDCTLSGTQNVCLLNACE